MSEHNITSASVSVVTSSLGANLQQLLECDDLLPGDDVSYNLAKAIFLYHPLGLKMAKTPVLLAQSQEREISVPASPEEMVIEAWKAQWKELHASQYILSVKTQSRIYGIATITVTADGEAPEAPIDLKKLYEQTLTFKVFDPLNTAGSLTYNQNPNSKDYQLPGIVKVQGTAYHPSRAVVAMNEEPIYIAWTSSAFGYVGRSVYQRALYPLKSFIQTMITDDMVARKAGVLVAKMEQPGSIINRAMQRMFGIKRNIVKEASTNNVISIGVSEDVTSLNLQNLDGAASMSRNNIIKNIATAADMPAKLLTQEAFVEGFGEGTQDAYAVAQYVNQVRIEMQPLYDWFDLICMYRAWNPDFYKSVQAKFPEEYGKKTYTDAFYDWKNSFKATWPSLIQEPPSEEVELDDVKLKGAIAAIQVLGPMLDPENRVKLVEWFCDNVNSHESIFKGTNLDLDYEELGEFIKKQIEEQKKLAEQQKADEPKPPAPFSRRDTSGTVASLAGYLAHKVEFAPKRARLAIS